MKERKGLPFEMLSSVEQKAVTGGTPHWLIPVGVTLLYNEISSIWNSGGQNLVDAWNSGYEAGYGSTDD